MYVVTRIRTGEFISPHAEILLATPSSDAAQKEVYRAMAQDLMDNVSSVIESHIVDMVQV